MQLIRAKGSVWEVSVTLEYMLLAAPLPHTVCTGQYLLLPWSDTLKLKLKM